jgi:hypothetical protein
MAPIISPSGRRPQIRRMNPPRLIGESRLSTDWGWGSFSWRTHWRNRRHSTRLGGAGPSSSFSEEARGPD